MHCGGAEAFALTEKHDAIASITNARCVLQHRLEDRFKLAGRAADNLEHVSGRRELLQRRFALAGDRATSVTSSGATEFGVLRRFNVLERRVFAALPPALSRRLIASPEAQTRHRSGSN